jgi:hypothetical protein
MNSVTTWSDILVLNCWLNLRSRWGWVVSIFIAVLITDDVLSPRPEGRPVAMALALYCMMIVTLLVIIWLVGFLVILLITTANLFRRGSIGPKRFTVSYEAFTEDDGCKITRVPWRQIRSVDKTRQHIFVRISRWRYLLLSIRDFKNEYEFAQYYADLVKAKHAHT